MPELAEVRSFSDVVNSQKGQTFVNIEKSEVHRLSDEPFVPIVKKWKKFHVQSKARGKEMILTVSHATKKKEQKHFLFKFGMSGCFRFYTERDEIHKHAHVTFEAENGGGYLCFVDQRRFGSWAEVDHADAWGDDRGPDPIDEYALFCKNVVEKIQKPKYWNAPIVEVLLMQELFNGIGNYLRAEICHEYGIDPFTKTKKVLDGLTEDNCEDHRFLMLCRDIPLKFFWKSEVNHNLSYTEMFEVHIQAYGRSDSLKRKDSKGRMVWWRSGSSSTSRVGEEEEEEEDEEEVISPKKKSNRQKKLEKKRKKKNAVVEEHEKKVKELESRTNKKKKKKAKLERTDTIILDQDEEDEEYEPEMTKAEKRKLEKNLRSKKKLYNSKKSQRMAKRK